MSLEEAVETTDATDDTDGQGLDVNCPRTCELRPRSEWDPVVQLLTLWNRRNRRPSELPVSGWVVLPLFVHSVSFCGNFS